MIRQLVFLLFLRGLISCSSNHQDIDLQKGIKTDTSFKASTIITGDPQIIDSSHIVIYPLILEQTAYEGGFSSGSSGTTTKYWNLIFYNTETHTQHLLNTGQKMVISSFNIDGLRHFSSRLRHIDADRANSVANTIFYDVTLKDFNQNDYLDENDPEYLFISDNEGNNFRQLSPDNYNVRSWKIIEGTSTVLIEAQKDDNNDKKFDQNDAIVNMIADVSSGKVAQELFNQSYIDSLKTILTQTWKAAKK